MIFIHCFLIFKHIVNFPKNVFIKFQVGYFFIDDLHPFMRQNIQSYNILDDFVKGVVEHSNSLYPCTKGTRDLDNYRDEIVDFWNKFKNSTIENNSNINSNTMKKGEILYYEQKLYGK